MVEIYKIDPDSELYHYGVPGMKWGKWNSETARKYGYSTANSLRAKGKSAVRFAKKQAKVIGKKAGAAGKAVSAATKKATSEAKKTVSEYMDKKKQEKALYEASGVKGRKEYEKLRKATLASHNPSVIIAGMHTLSDSELALKINRLRQEDQVIEIANNRAQRAAETKRKQEEAIKATKERRNSGFLAGVARNAANKLTDYAGKKAIDKLFEGLTDTDDKKKGNKENKKNEDKKTENKKSDANEKAITTTNSSSSSSSNNSSKSSTGSSSDNKPSDSGYSGYSSTNTNKSVTNNIRNYYVKTDSQAAAYNVGKAAAEDIIDITPSDSSHEYYKKNDKKQ